jgi:hypothetical protein
MYVFKSVFVFECFYFLCLCVCCICAFLLKVVDENSFRPKKKDFRPKKRSEQKKI